MAAGRGARSASYVAEHGSVDSRDHFGKGPWNRDCELLSFLNVLMHPQLPE
eukprot:CAMPEP_0173334278 /NCGR_PEP_ID=MMETSP1144-20121109/5347_1 /TAXON_ID=483371 /ORGANISM="non described non described, Strain CCMP2298" /LENGTH=50 /DNA_ID=CAMNT_0014279311 /DNA_START=811 /DNA_END=960 /DNA_ORIENTATION=+